MNLMNLVVAAVHDASPAPSPLPVTVPGSGIFQSSLLLSILVWAPVLVAVMIGYVVKVVAARYPRR